jgi:hypothetical protein
MSARRAFDAVEHARVAKPQPSNIDGLDLFAAAAPPSWTERWASLTAAERDAQRERWKDALLPLVEELAEKSGPEGITASEVQTAAILAGKLNGDRVFLKNNPRVYSWLGAWLASLASGGTLVPKTLKLEGGGSIKATRASERDASHANVGYVYLHPRVAA